MDIETAGASGCGKEMEMGTEMGSGSWKEMEMETEMGTDMMASEAVASRRANRSVCNPERPPHRTPSTHGLAPSLRASRALACSQLEFAPVPDAWTSRCA